MVDTAPVERLQYPVVPETMNARARAPPCASLPNFNSMNHIKLSALTLALASSVIAQGGNGSSADLEPSPMAINSTFTLKISGRPAAPWSLWLSGGTAVNNFPGIGTVWLDFASPSLGELANGNLPAGAGVTYTTLSFNVPNDPAYLGFEAYLQCIVVDPTAPGGVGLSRCVRIDFENPDSFVPVGSLSGSRALGSADLLPDGRVLVAGGGSGSLTAAVGTATCEAYNPLSRSWSAVASMATQRAFHTSVTLSDGRIMVIGGADGTGAVTNTCEIYDPIGNAWYSVASMTTQRAAHTATLLANGKVLVAGGCSSFTSLPGSTTPLGDILGTSKDTGEVYDPALNTWAPVSNAMASKRFAASATRLNDGRVVLVSGLNGTGSLAGVEVPAWTNTVSIYSPITNSFAAGPNISTPRTAHRATLMPNGEVFVSGGLAPTYFLGILLGITTSNSAVKLSSAGTAWSSAGTMPAGALLHGQVLLKNGKVHLSGGTTVALAGTTLTTSAIANCATRLGGGTTFTSTTPLPAARGTHFAVRLFDGSILVAGGSDAASTSLSDCLLYTPTP